MDLPFNALFSSATGATPNPVDKKKYFKPVVTPEPMPSINPKPSTNPAVVKNDVLIPGASKTDQSNANKGLGSPGYNYKSAETSTKANADYSAGTKKQEPSEVKTEPESGIFENKALTWLKSNWIIALVIVVVISAITYGVVQYSKKKK